MKSHLLPALAGLAAAALTAATVSGQYTMTVSQDRLRNAQNESQNWLMMNGDYASTRYSKLTQINRDERQRPSAGLGDGARRHAGRRTERPGERAPSAGRQRLPLHERRLGHDLQDRRPQSQQGRVRVGDRPRREARGERAPLARDRALGRARDRQPPRRPRDRGEPQQRRDRVGQDGGGDQRIRRQGTVLYRADRRRRQGDCRQRRRRREDARLDRRARCAIRQRALALVRRAEAGRSGQRNLEGYEQRLEDRRRRPLADRFLRPRDQAHHLGHRQSGADLRSAGASGRQPLHQFGGGAERRHRQAGLVLPVHAERFLGLRRGRRAHAVRHDDQRPQPQGRRPFRAQRVSSTRWIAATANSSWAASTSTI